MHTYCLEMIGPTCICGGQNSGRTMLGGLLLFFLVVYWYPGITSWEDLDEERNPIRVKVVPDARNARYMVHVLIMFLVRNVNPR